jgi:hypothetical protein
MQTHSSLNEIVVRLAQARIAAHQVAGFEYPTPPRRTAVCRRPGGPRYRRSGAGRAEALFDSNDCARAQAFENLPIAPQASPAGRGRRRRLAMSAHQAQGPMCRSGGMPLVDAEDRGTAANGSRVDDYCRYCYANGTFTQPDAMLPGMLDKCVAIMAAKGLMPEAQARALMFEILPKLRRWQSGQGGRSARPRGQPCSRAYFACNCSFDSLWLGSGTMQSAGHTSMHCGSSCAPTHSVHLSGSIT